MGRRVIAALIGVAVFSYNTALCVQGQEESSTRLKGNATASDRLLFNNQSYQYPRQDVDEVREALAKGANPDAVSEEIYWANGVRYGNTALIIAAHNNDRDVAQLLLDAGADINAKNSPGYTALMAAVSAIRESPSTERPHWRAGSPDAVRLLLDRGANVNARTNSDVTALMVAAGALLDDRDGWNRPAKNVPEKTEFVRLLLQKGADVNARSESGTTALLLAARTQTTHVMRLLLQAGADRNSQNAALNEIVRLSPRDDYSDAPAIVQLLLESGTNPNAGNGAVLKTILRAFTGYSSDQMMQDRLIPILQLLLNGGVNLKSQAGTDLLKMTTVAQWSHAATLIRQAGAKP